MAARGLHCQRYEGSSQDTYPLSHVFTPWQQTCPLLSGARGPEDAGWQASSFILISFYLPSILFLYSPMIECLYLASNDAGAGGARQEGGPLAAEHCDAAAQGCSLQISFLPNIGFHATSGFITHMHSVQQRKASLASRCRVFSMLHMLHRSGQSCHCMMHTRCTDLCFYCKFV